MQDYEHFGILIEQAGPALNARDGVILIVQDLVAPSSANMTRMFDSALSTLVGFTAEEFRNVTSVAVEISGIFF